MPRKQKLEPEVDDPKVVVQRLEIKRHEVWWYKQGAFITTGIVAAAIWFVMIGPKEISPKTEMIEPATNVLSTGVKPAKDLNTVSKDLNFKVVPPDLKQLGGKLIQVGKSEFGGKPAATMQYQYGKSVLILYRFIEPIKLLDEMKQVHAGPNLFYLSSGGAVSVIAWKDHHSGYYALAAKATEKDLLSLAGKVVRELK